MSDEHLIIQGDCLCELPKIPDNSIDVVLTDPPFNIRKRYRSYRDDLKKTDYLLWCHQWLEQCIRVMKDGAALYVINYPENNAYLMPWLDERLTNNGWLTWHYATNTGHSKTKFTRSQHSALFYVKGTPPPLNLSEIAEPYRNPNDKRIKERIANGSPGRMPDDVFEFNLVKNVSKEKTAHPCQIPIKMLEKWVRASAPVCGTVLDPFGGSFSTAMACKAAGRKSISIELDPGYCEAGRLRLG